MTSLVPVQPALAPIIKYVRINIYELILGQGFKCVCQLLDEEKMIIVTKELTIEGDEYNNWVSDEEMTNLILSKLGLIPKRADPEPTPTPAPEPVPEPTQEPVIPSVISDVVPVE